MKDDDESARVEINAIIGKIVSALLKPGEVLDVHQLIGSLYRLSNRTDDAKIKESCLAAIRLLANKMH